MLQDTGSPGCPCPGSTLSSPRPLTATIAAPATKHRPPAPPGALGASPADALFLPLEPSSHSPFQAGVGQGGQSFAHVAGWLFAVSSLSRGVCERTSLRECLGSSPWTRRGPAALGAGGQSRAAGAGWGGAGRAAGWGGGLQAQLQVPCSHGAWSPRSCRLYMKQRGSASGRSRSRPGRTSRAPGTQTQDPRMNDGNVY